ncbi:MEDS domain-containing protein [Streptomyces sp. ISL-100]|uniref:MEDS domain-containing protein n=1 Tax=Streptomyces sp. ISL-100 TaxID=2819173 RepID=UPI0027E4DF6B|nr:MEDS domain-containing protein [Streptomyces sp. ISL-100]
MKRREVPGRRTRIIAEPLWAGKSARQIAEWKCMESGLNVLLADRDVWMICPYDTRTVPEDVAAAARATHPAHVVGAKILPCAAYVDPDAYAAVADAPLPPPPLGADRLDGPATPAAVRAFVRGSAARAGLSGARLAMAEIVANEGADLPARPRRYGGGGVRVGRARHRRLGPVRHRAGYRGSGGLGGVRTAR